MTDEKQNTLFEEKAEKWIKANTRKAENDFGMTFCVRPSLKDAYIAGATENGVVWHDLRIDPNDLPKDNQSVWTNKGGAYHDSDGWFDDFGHVNAVIAWCIPEFKEVNQ